MLVAPAPHLVDVLLEAVSDRQGSPGGPAAATPGAGARRPDTHAARIRNSSCSAPPLASIVPAAPAPYLVDVLLEAVSDCQGAPSGPAATAAGAGAPHLPLRRPLPASGPRLGVRF